MHQTRDETGLVINKENVFREDGWGWYGQIECESGPFIPSLNLGAAISGYEADNEFGWIMIGHSNNEPISIISQLGGLGDLGLGWLGFVSLAGFMGTTILVLLATPEFGRVSQSA